MNKAVGWAFVAIVAIALLQVLLPVLVLAVALAVLIAFVARPLETLAGLCTLFVIGLACAFPLPFIAGVAVLGAAVVLARPTRKARDAGSSKGPC